jgi:hypothetical protein
MTNTDLLQNEPAVATLNTTFSVGDEWKCQCSEIHRFGHYVAAHWDEALNHTCKPCGRKRTFLSGEVVGESP